MTFESFCIEITGIKDPIAAKKITLLFILTWFFMLMVAYYTISYIDSLGADVVRTLNVHVMPSYEPHPYGPQ